MSSSHPLAGVPVSPTRGANPILVDAWYAQSLAPFGASAFDAAIAARFAPTWLRLARRVGGLRGLLLFLVSRESERLILPLPSRGLLTLLALHALFSRRPPKVYLVEFLRAQPHGPLSHLKEAFHLLAFRPLLRRLLTGAQVMTQWEANAYAARYRLPVERFRFIAFPMIRVPSGDLPEPVRGTRRVLSSGRAACDWATLMEAARSASWPLTIVCSEKDRAAVNALNGDGRAQVLSEISHEHHQQLLNESAVYALVLREQRASSGQVRLARAIESGVPVVATQVRGLDGYLDPGVTALVVPTGDAPALRQAIDSLLNDPEQHDALRHRAHAAMQARSLPEYVERVRAFVLPPAP